MSDTVTITRDTAHTLTDLLDGLTLHVGAPDFTVQAQRIIAAKTDLASALTTNPEE